MSGGIHTLVGVAAGAVLFAGCFWTAYLLAWRLTGRAATSIRWCATAVVAYWLLTASCTILAWCDAFRLWVTLILWSVAAVLAQRRAVRRGLSPGNMLRGDLACIASLFRSLWRTRFRWVLVATTVLVAVRVLRGLLAPPLGWDALTYHLLKAGRWVQTGGFAPEAAPDAWSCYEYYPHTGEVPWAWAMLPAHGDAFLALAALLIWLSCLLGAYGAARGFGAEPTRAVRVAPAIALTPAVFAYLTAAYPDIMLLAVFLLGAVFLQRALADAAPADAVLAAAAFGVAAGIRLTAVPILLVVLAALALRLWRAASGQHSPTIHGSLRPLPQPLSEAERGARGQATSTPFPRREGGQGVRWAAMRTAISGADRLRIAAGCVLAASIGLPPYARAWIATGSPLYPLGLSLGGWRIFPANPVFALVAGTQLVDVWTYSTTRFLEALFAPRQTVMGWGPAAPLVMLLGFVGAWQHRHRPETRLADVALLFSAALILASLASADTLALRLIWASSSVRFVVPAYAALAILGARVRGRAADQIWLLAVGVSVFYAIPSGFSQVDLAAFGELMLGLVPAALLTTWLLRRPSRTALQLSTVILLLLAVIVWAGDIRSRYRYRWYAAASLGESFDVHPLRYASAWPVWRALDDGPAHRVAVTAGWNGTGDNWYRYPLLGSRLQNSVTYVPPTRDGSLLHYSLEKDPAARADFDAWVHRLEDDDIDMVVALDPPNVEAGWMRAHPERFERVACNRGDVSCVYRLRRN